MLNRRTHRPPTLEPSGPASHRPPARRRRPAAWAAVVATAALGAAASIGTGDPAAAASRSRTPCTTQSGTTILATTAARVYRRGASDESTYYGCWIASHRRTELSETLDIGENSSGAGSFSLSGRFLAFEESGTSGEEGYDVVSLVDLRTGKVARKATAVIDPDADYRTATVNGVVATTDGTLVWSGRAKDCYGVHATGPAGTRTLSCGVTSDLAAVGRRVYWTQDGQPRGAVPSRP